MRLAIGLLAALLTAGASAQGLPIGSIPISSGGGGPTVALVGTGCTASNFVASINVPVPSTLASGGGVVLWALGASTYTSTLTISDTGGNSWSSTPDFTNTYSGYSEIQSFYSSPLTNSISGGGHITVALSNGTSEDWILCPVYASVMPSSGAFDAGGFVVNSFSGTNYTSPATGTGTATTTNATDLCIGTLHGSGSITSATWVSPFTSLLFEVDASRFNTISWEATTTAAVQRGHATLNASDNSNGEIVCYKQ